MVDDSSPWVTFGSLRAFRYIRYRAPWSPAAASNSSGGRFDNGVRLTLYVADNAKAATAEFYRRNPEFLPDQTIARIQVFALDLTIVGRCLDVRTPANAAAVAIPFDRLRSNDRDEATRYAECRRLADDTEPVGCGIAYPSAASTATGAWSLVLFGLPAAATWRCDNYDELVVPEITESDVRLLPA